MLNICLVITEIDNGSEKIDNVYLGAYPSVNNGVLRGNKLSAEELAEVKAFMATARKTKDEYRDPISSMFDYDGYRYER